MDKVYKRILCFIIMPILFAAFPFFIFADVKDSAAFDWYFKPKSDNSQPELCPEADFISDYDVITIAGSDEKSIYLTFDAGYDNGYHTTILDTLKERNVSAAFFVDGNFVRQNPQLIKRMAEEGHLVCNHTLSHPDMTKLIDFATYKKQIDEWEKLVKDAGVIPSKYFRFPSGRFSRLALDYNKKIGLTTVFWSFAYYDWDKNEQPDAQAALEKIYSRIHNGAVMLLHSTSKTNAQILPEFIDSMRSRGYDFKSLEEFKK